MPPNNLSLMAHADPCTLLWCQQFSQSRTILSANLCGRKRSLKPYQNEHNSVKKAGGKGLKNVKLTWKIPIKILFDYPSALSSNPAILRYFPKTFPLKGKKLEKKSERIEVGGGKAQSKTWDCCMTFKPTKFIFEVTKIYPNVFI